MKEEHTLCLIVYNKYSSDQISGEDISKENSAAEEFEDMKAIKKALKEMGFQVRAQGIRNITPKVVQGIIELSPDVIFNLCESLNGDSKSEMHVAGLFDLLEIPYTGSPSFALGLALNKIKTKQILKAIGIPVPPSVLVSPGEEFKADDLTPPYIVKPVGEDGSSGIFSKSVVYTAEEVNILTKTIHRDYKQAALVEEIIEGKELTVFVVGDKEPRVLGIGEIDFSDFPKGEPKIISYHAKWDTRSPLFRTAEHIICPANIPSSLKTRIERVALKTFKEIGCKDYARIDIRISENRRVYVLEVNTNPFLDPSAGFGQACESAGISYNAFIKEIVENAMKRKNKNPYK